MRNAVTLACALTLASCGGGGGSGADSPATTKVAPTTTNVSAAYAAVVRTPRSYSLSGTTSTGIALTALLTTSTLASTTYNAKAYDRSAVTVAVFRASVQQSSNTVTLWFPQGTLNLIFLAYSANGFCSLATDATLLPTSASIESTGPYFSGTRYPSCSALGDRVFVPAGNVSSTWTYSAYNGSGWMCINSTITDFATVTESDCFEVADSTGTLTGRVRVTTKDGNGVTTTLSN